MQDEYGLTLKEGEADMYKHSTNRDVRYAERELHFVIPSTVQGITHLAINIRYQELSYHSISHSQK